MTTWFTSDTHYYHKAIIGYCSRPVPGMLHPRRPAALQDDNCQALNVGKMNDWLIERFNEKVKPDDEVWHLGDFAFCGKEKALDILKRLNGRKHWVLGNHDYGLAKKDEIRACFESIQSYKMLRVNIPYEDENEEPQQHTQPIVLCHFPILSWDGMAHGSWMLHGHCHGSIDNSWNSTGLRLDVGVDSHNWFPISIADICQKLVMRTVVPVDHHNSSENNPAFKK